MAGGALQGVADLPEGPLKMAKLIEPNVLKGFRDFLPEREAARLGQLESAPGGLQRGLT